VNFRERIRGVVAAAYFQNVWDSLWNRLERRPIAHMVGLYVLCIVVFLLAVPLPRVDSMLIGSDGVYYYAYLPTLLLDHDLDFTNEYSRMLPYRKFHVAGATMSRLPANKHGIGAAILWAPFFLIGHLAVLGLNVIGYRIQLDGMSYVYQVPTLLGSLTYGFAGLLLIYRSCSRFFSRSISAAAAILIWLATNVIYYMLAEPSMSHTCSLFAVALFLELWLAFRPMPKMHQWILLGLAGGLIALVRQPDVTWIALPVIDSLLERGRDWRQNLLRDLKGFVVFGMTAVAVFIPQMIVWRTLYGTATRGGYLSGRSHFHWLDPKILQVLFSMQHGLYLWHPLLLLASAGLFLLYRKDRRLTFLLGFLFALQVYVIGSWGGWMGGDSFGSRMLISSLPALALGLAALIEWTAARGARTTIGVLGSALIAWNALFFIQYRLGYIPRFKPITFEELTLGKLSMLQDLAHRIRLIL
jgi:hypothetical protein